MIFSVLRPTVVRTYPRGMSGCSLTFCLLMPSGSHQSAVLVSPDGTGPRGGHSDSEATGELPVKDPLLRRVPRLPARTVAGISRDEPVWPDLATARAAETRAPRPRRTRNRSWH